MNKNKKRLNEELEDNTDIKKDKEALSDIADEDGLDLSFSLFLEQLFNLGQSKSIETIKELLSKFTFKEGGIESFNNKPVEVKYITLPLFTDSYLFVKVVVLEQAEDNIAIIMPDNISHLLDEDFREDKVFDEDLVNQANISLELYAEISGFDSKAEEFRTFCINCYVESGNGEEAFTFDEVAKKKAEKEAGVDEGEQGSEVGGIGLGGVREPTNPLFNRGEMKGRESENVDLGDTGNAFSEPIEDTSNLKALGVNESAYKKFNKQGVYLESLVRKVNNFKSLRNYIRYRFLNENSNILVLEVDNRSIYNTFKNKVKAKKTLTGLGELIKDHDGTQLVDSFINDNKRYFVLAESKDNYWYVKDEDNEVPTDYDVLYIKPKKDNVIILERSEVRNEARHHKVFKESKNSNNDKVIFLEGKR